MGSAASVALAIDLVPVKLHEAMDDGFVTLRCHQTWLSPLPLIEDFRTLSDIFFPSR